MSKRVKTVNKIELMQPDELNALKDEVKEFLDRLHTIDNEIETLKEDRKELIVEYSEKLDMKTLNAAMKIVKIKKSVEHKDAFDQFLEIMDGPASDVIV